MSACPYCGEILEEVKLEEVLEEGNDGQTFCPYCDGEILVRSVEEVIKG